MTLAYPHSCTVQGRFKSLGCLVLRQPMPFSETLDFRCGPKPGRTEGIVAGFPPILKVDQLAALLQLSKKTVYEWTTKGRLDGAFRKRGKHHLIWRDRALELLFNGPDWKQ